MRLPLSTSRGAVTGAVLCLALTMIGSAQPLDPARLGWTHLEYQAHKLFVSTTSTVSVESLSPAAASAELGDGDPDSPAPTLGAAGVLALTLDTDLLGRHSHTRLLVDPADGRALQRVALDTGKRFRFKRSRFSSEAVSVERREPLSTDEQGLPPERWTQVTHERDTFPAAGPPATDAAALFYLAAAGALSKPGDQLSAAVFSRHHKVAIELVVDRRERLAVEYTEARNGTTRTVQREVEALVVAVRSAPDSEEAVQLLGLEGDIELLLEPEDRFPLEIRGRIRIAGDVRVRLGRVELRALEPPGQDTGH